MGSVFFNLNSIGYIAGLGSFILLQIFLIYMAFSIPEMIDLTNYKKTKLTISYFAFFWFYLFLSFICFKICF